MTSFAYDLKKAGVPMEMVERLLRPGDETLIEAMARATQSLIRPMMRDIIAWAEENVYLPPGMGYASGLFKALQWQAGVMRCWQDDQWERVIGLKAPRCGFSFVTAIAMLYLAFHEGQDVVLLERSLGKAKTFWEQYIDPMIEASPALKAKRRPKGMERWFDMVTLDGAMLHFRGCEDFRGYKGKWVFVEEAGDDAWLPDTGGNKLDRAALRASAFGDGILGVASSPKLSATCQVTAAWNLSAQHEFRMECPCCGHRQPLLPTVQPEDDQPGLYFRLDQHTGEFASYSDPTTGLVTPDVWYRCSGPKECIFREKWKPQMLDTGLWEIARPDAKVGRRKWAGFYLPGVLSLDPRSTWHHIAKDYVAQLTDRRLAQTFRNERQALPFDAENVRAVEPHWVRQRRSYAYPAPTPPVVGAAFVGSDNQKVGAETEEKRAKTGRFARSEVSVLGVGPQDRMAVLAHIVIPHAPFTHESNEQKLRIANSPFMLPDGRHIMPGGALDDIGDGTTIDAAIQFVSSKEAQACGWLGVIGINEAFGSRRPTVGHGKAKHGHWEYERIGKQSAIDTLMAKLQQDGFGAGSIVFPKSFGDRYFKSLTAVKRMEKEGSEAFSWVDLPDNEALDCLVYAYARSLLVKRNLPASAAIFENPALDREGEWAMEMIRKGLPDRSYQSALWSAESRVLRAGGCIVDPDGVVTPLVMDSKPSEAWSTSRFVPPPAPQAKPVVPAGPPPQHQQQPRPGAFVAPDPYGGNAPIPRAGGQPSYGRIGPRR